MEQLIILVLIVVAAYFLFVRPRQQREKDGPQALRLGANSIGWPSRVVDEWLASRPAAGP